MKPLRIVKERIHHSETDNDLRGLGDIVNIDNTPLPILTLSGEWRAINRLAEDLKISELEVDNGDGLSHLVCNDSEKDHKQKALYLFSFALVLKTVLNIDSFLWEKSQLHENLSIGILNLKPEHQKIELNKGVCLDYGIQLHLHQSGFQFQVEENNKTLSNKEQTDCYHLMNKSSLAHEKKRKVV